MATSSLPPESPVPTLRRQVADLLNGYHPDRAIHFLETFYPIENEPVEAEIRRLNRYWRHQLNQLPIDTIPQRDHLVDQSTPTDWISLFIAGVLSTVAEYRLPL